MTGTCRAAVFLGDETYEIREFPMPDPPPGGAVLQVEAVGLCGSDVAQFGASSSCPARRVPGGPRARDRRAGREARRPTPSSAWPRATGSRSNEIMLGLGRCVSTATPT